MKALFDKLSHQSSKSCTQLYSTSFSMGIRTFNKAYRQPIYDIYGFVRIADEIVDSFHEYPKRALFDRFVEDTFLAIENKISLNPILNSFQEVVHRYNIDIEHIHCFLKSMEMDLEQKVHNEESYKTYILGSAEVVGLMCLHVFCDGDRTTYEQLKAPAMKLGSAFQKINFLRDINADYVGMGRIYFPEVNMENFNEDSKSILVAEIKKDFHDALEGIKRLPKSVRFGVLLAYRYYYLLAQKIFSTPANELLEKRIRISNFKKLGLMLQLYLSKKISA